MAKVVRTRDEIQQRIVKLLNSMDGKYSRWQIWQDFILMYATSIANVFPGPYREEREQSYLEVAAKYGKKEMETIAEMMALTVAGMDANPDQDFLGELYMALELGNVWKGQFFTPYCVCQMMASMTLANDIKDRCEQQGFVSVNDPACGAGALLIAFANECRRKGINFQQQVLFTAQDIDLLAGMMCYIQLSLMGCPGYVVIDNTLTKPALMYDKRGLLPVDKGNVWYTPMYYSDRWQIRQIAARLDLLTRFPKKASEEVVKKLEPVMAEIQKAPEPVTVPELKADETGQLSLF